MHGIRSVTTSAFAVRCRRDSPPPPQWASVGRCVTHHRHIMRPLHMMIPYHSCVSHHNIVIPPKFHPSTTTIMWFSSSAMHRGTSRRSHDSQYASRDEHNHVSPFNYNSHHRQHHMNHPTPAFHYSSMYPLTVCGLQLSAVPLSQEAWSEADDDAAVFQPRPHPPPLSDETLYGDGFGAYQYNDLMTNDDTDDTDIYDHQVNRLPSRFVPKPNSKYTAATPPQKTTTTTPPLVKRPPVQVSIPSSSTNGDMKSPPPPPSFNVDLSAYDNLLEDPPQRENDHDRAAVEPVTITSTATTTPPPPPEKDTIIPSPKDTRESFIPTTHFHAGQTLNDLPGYDPALDQFLTKAAYGVGMTTSIDVLQEELAAKEQAIYELNNQQTFNINSPKQVAAVLFGPNPGTNVSTNKDKLEGMAGAGNRLAALILQYRSIKYKLAKYVRQVESKKKGTAVRSAYTVARPIATASPTVIPPPPKDNLPKTELSSTTLVVPDLSTTTATQPPPPPAVPTMSNVMSDPLLILDASAYIFRAYYSMPPIHRPDGMPTGAVMGFCKMLNSLLLNRMLDGEQPRLVLCFDAKGKTFRHDLYDKYKANRAAAPMDLVPQFDLVRQAAKAYGICQIDAQRFEADDVIATLACRAVEEGVDANIMSGDKDLMQLVTDLNATPSIQIIDPMKKERTTYQQVMEKWQVPPNMLGDLLALSGDVADNVPGVRGIGPKTAAKLLNDFGSLENLLNNIDSVKQQGVRDKLSEDKANARLSRLLVDLNCTVPFSELTGLPDGEHQKVSDLRMEPIDPDRIIAFYDQMGFKDLKRSFQNSLKGLNVKRKKSSSYNKRVKATIPTPEDYKDVPF